MSGAFRDDALERLVGAMCDGTITADDTGRLNALLTAATPNSATATASHANLLRLSDSGFDVIFKSSPEVNDDPARFNPQSRVPSGCRDPKSPPLSTASNVACCEYNSACKNM